MCIGGGSSVGPPTLFAYRLTQLTFLFALGYRSDKQEPEQIMNTESLAHHDEWARSVFLDERFAPNHRSCDLGCLRDVLDFCNE
jgi:hypothetical protein